jgi:hypothetical protein
MDDRARKNLSLPLAGVYRERAGPSNQPAEPPRMTAKTSTTVALAPLRDLT